MSIRRDGYGGPESLSVFVRITLLSKSDDPAFVLHPNDLERVELFDDDMKGLIWTNSIAKLNFLDKIRAELLKMDANKKQFNKAGAVDDIDGNFS
jgi:hypothetical protein